MFNWSFSLGDGNKSCDFVPDCNLEDKFGNKFCYFVPEYMSFCEISDIKSLAAIWRSSDLWCFVNLILYFPKKFLYLQSQYGNGALAERLGTGLQNLLQRFDSARHLTKNLLSYWKSMIRRFSFSSRPKFDNNLTAQRKIPVVLSFPYHRHKAGGASPLA